MSSTLIRRAALPAVAVALVLPLAACGGSKSSSSSSASGSPSGSAASGKEVTLTVLAAASLDNVFKAEGAAYEKAHPGTTVRFSFAGSQDLAAQVKQGVPADVLVTADTKTMDGLKSETGSPTIIAKNRLTIATAPGNPKKITGLDDLSKSSLKVVLAAPQVPVGNYGDKVLKAQHVTVHPVSQEASVTAVLSKVELGEADAGIVYVTDAEGAKGKVGTVTIPDSQNAIASYPAATLDDSKDKTDASAFVSFLASSQGQSILRSYGFQQP
ncbi:molybdate ABC transporter substrate-binding protein [Streptomyces sp. PTM05]|uniref:Molybdate ABC transporter substrate-binding protein n=1 Tax=Streptantibioticus parmotrematis TaxID=2873249 RepID=A0ABS7QLZ4_9ACTN|nr:molybdate ABC transporter substrate-binding protein [Streptantibioticus parmotrematis]MBY8884213.1 molybdate ABC transporter substrate-binding protein [Streptantibioticus parmotrematis]